jgi:hypothetical protein
MQQAAKTAVEPKPAWQIAPNKERPTTIDVSIYPVGCFGCTTTSVFKIDATFSRSETTCEDLAKASISEDIRGSRKCKQASLRN